MIWIDTTITGLDILYLLRYFCLAFFSLIYGIVYMSRHFEDVQILAKYVDHDKTIITSEGDKLQEVTLEINGKTYTFTLTSKEE